MFKKSYLFELYDSLQECMYHNGTNICKKINTDKGACYQINNKSNVRISLLQRTLLNVLFISYRWFDCVVNVYL